MSTNIGRDNTDSSYRYKMPLLQIKIEGRGNGIKTVITNIVEISKALHIHPAYPTKYFGIELGAQSKYIPKDERSMVNGSFMISDLSKILEKFIDQLILCPKCKLPELKMSVRNSVKIDCAACGYNGEIKSNHKIIAYIIKNPPKTLKEGRDHTKDKERKKAILEQAVAEEIGDVVFDDKKEKKPKKELKRFKKNRANKDSTSPNNQDSNEDANESGDSGLDDASPVATNNANGALNGNAHETSEQQTTAPAQQEEKVREKKKKEKKSKNKHGSSRDRETAAASDDDDSADEWHTEVSKEAIAARKQTEFKEAKEKESKRLEIEKLSLSNSSSSNPSSTSGASINNQSSDDSPVSVLRRFISSKPRTEHEIASELSRIQVSRGINDFEKQNILLAALFPFNDSCNVKQVATVDFAKHVPLFKKLCVDRLSCLNFINALEFWIGSDVRLLPFTGLIFQTCYEADILSEELIIEWFMAPFEASLNKQEEMTQRVKQRCKVFVNWLQAAEEEEESD